ncbi:MAG: hypothetical protein V3V33_10845 [Candidatus Lokiarchaeia archaeon]
MPGIFQELWIFSQDGLPLAEFCEDDVMDKNLLGPFLSAIKSFAQKLTKSELSSFTIGNFKLTCISALNGKVFLAGRTHLKTKDKTIKNACKIISEIFEDMYDPSGIENWDGDLAFFDRFKDKLDLYFKMSSL